MYFIIGLGNPGLTYKRTRHNVGFMVLDVLGKKYQVKFGRDSGPSRTAKFTLVKQSILLAKPYTYMNLSGKAVKALIDKYKIKDLSKMLVICDDINLPFGVLRMRASGSAGGQKGLVSIINQLATAEFPRLRIGIGNHFSDAAAYVLSPFSEKEQQDLSLILHSAAEAVESFIVNDLHYTMSRYNRNWLAPDD